MKKIVLIAALIGSVGLAGCQTTQSSGTNQVGTKQGVGTLGGAVLGGLAGSSVGKGSGQLWATGAGALLGAYLGGEVGKSLDRADKLYMGQATGEAHTAPIGETISWNNPESGNEGTITPVRDGRSSSGEYCREYQTTVTIDGVEERAYGTACQRLDGTWQVVN